MKIQRNPLKNKTIINPSKLRLNSKIIKRFTNSSIKTSKTILDNKNLNFIYMALNKTIKLNNLINQSTNKHIRSDKSTSYDKNIQKNNNNKSCVLQNMFLVNLLNKEKIKLNTNHIINNNIKKVNMNKYFIENYKNSSLYEDKKYINNNKKEKNYNSIDSTKRKQKIFFLMNTKSNMRYIKENPFFKDLNLQPSSEKSWLFAYDKPNRIKNKNSKIFENNISKRLIPKINIKKNINKSNLLIKSKNYNKFLLKDFKIRKGNRTHTKKINCNISNKSIYKTNITKNDKIIFGYKCMKNKNYKNQTINNIKNNKLSKLNYENYYNKRKINNENNNQKNILRLNSCKYPKNIPRIIFNNELLNSLNYNENKEDNKDIETNNINEDEIMTNALFSDDINENDDCYFINPIYS